MDLEEHEDWPTAVHEAGHAVMCYELDVRIDSVELNEEGGVVHFDEETSARNKTLITMAGPFAEFAVIGEDWTPDWTSRESDEVVQCARDALVEEGFEFEGVEDFDEELSSYLIEARNETNSLLQGKTGQIESLAKALIQERTIPGSDVESYIYGR